MAEREAMISQIEFASRELRASGKCAAWFEGCDEILKQATEGVNGFLLQELLAASRHVDESAAEVFRKGARMLDQLECSGIGKPVPWAQCKSVARLRQNVENSNRALLSQLRGDENGEALLKLTGEAAGKGWMTQPVPLDQADVRDVLLNPRFAVEQAGCTT